MNPDTTSIWLNTASTLSDLIIAAVSCFLLYQLILMRQQLVLMEEQNDLARQ